MASTALGSAYVLTDEGARQLAEMAAAGSAPVSTPGFVSNRSYDPAERDRKLTALQRLVAAHDRG